MNIFYLDHDPRKAAQAHVDSHVVKMPVEYAQLLSSAHACLDGSSIGYGLSNPGHPSAVWARQSLANYTWLYHLFREVSDEYFVRYGPRQHKTWLDLGDLLAWPPDNIVLTAEFTPPPPAMPHEHFRYGANGRFDSIESYRAYYRDGKQHLHRWSCRARPDWCKDW